ncbi:MAG: Gfo/Idh/MocA family oxidoreductase [Kiritimatiellae bacterium]|nr:Gfo/Idh/MocA family oxidoreductase [Kiritimatiellia bacterium]MDD5520976.1 Gfo/Idh/MocA family oxidoreductase [Kiritimatiellia bacterium]
MNKNKSLSSAQFPNNCSRRNFMHGSAAVLSTMIIAPKLVRGAEANSKLSLGLIGCGGRGTWIADLFMKNGGYEIAACADYFQDKVDAFGQKFNIDPSRRYTGLNCHKKMVESKLDAVAIISPPYFHPEQAAAAVEAGKHVYLAKPIAVDVPGCKSIDESGKKATEKKLAFLIDFQTRANQFYQEAVKRVHEGAIGNITFSEACYQCGALNIRATPGTPEARLRNWPFDIALSGDIIVEQNIHTLDVMNWIFQKPPINVFGSGGRKVRLEAGDCWDHFGLIYQYDNGVPVVFNSKQYNDGAGEHDKGIVVNVFGSLGRVETKYGGKVMILGKNFYAGGATGDIYKEGAVNNIATFHKQITSGAISNTTVEPSVQSNMIAIMGRTAAYQHKLVTWDELKNSTEKLDPKLDGLKS